MTNHQALPALPAVLRVAEWYAKKYPRFCDEIISAAHFGLLEAARKWVSSKASFQTFAIRVVKWRIADELRTCLTLKGYRRTRSQPRKCEHQPKILSFDPASYTRFYKEPHDEK